MPLLLESLELSWQMRHHLNSTPSYTSTISSPSAMLTIILSFSSMLLTRRRCCMLALMRVAR
uniref:Mitochondrial chaperone BCS1 n=1 Tax=Arundo donax TaxID=35708 RepID=A0A0A9FJP9_ARUDO